MRVSVTNAVVAVCALAFFCTYLHGTAVWQCGSVHVCAAGIVTRPAHSVNTACALAALSGYAGFVIAWQPGARLASASSPQSQLAAPPSPSALRGTQVVEVTAGPPTRQVLGRGTWGLLHRMAAKYPQNPTAQEQEQLFQFLKGLGQFFPCSDCAKHFRGMLRDFPPDTSSNLAYSLWLCKVHNIVNKRVGHAQFVCEKDVLQERWGDCGCFDGSASGSGAAAA